MFEFNFLFLQRSPCLTSLYRKAALMRLCLKSKSINWKSVTTCSMIQTKQTNPTSLWPSGWKALRQSISKPTMIRLLHSRTIQQIMIAQHPNIQRNLAHDTRIHRQKVQKSICKNFLTETTSDNRSKMQWKKFQLRKSKIQFCLSLTECDR